DIVEHDRRRIGVVHGNMEETLNLIGVQVNGQQTVDANTGHHVRHDLGADGNPGRAGATILAGIAEVGEYRRDPTGRGAAQCVGHDQQLQQVVVGRRTGRLDDEDVAATDILVDYDAEFVVDELSLGGGTERAVEDI